MEAVITAPAQNAAVLGENASFLLLRHSVTSTRLGLDIGAVQVGRNVERNMRSFELLSVADLAGINYWDAAQLYTTATHLKGAGTWQRFNAGQWIIATHIFIPKSDINRNLSHYIRDIATRQCELLACKHIDIMFLAADRINSIKEIEPQLAAVAHQGLVRSFGHIAFTTQQAQIWITQPTVSLLHLQLKEVRLPELMHVFDQAQCQRLGIVLVLTPALVSCLYQANTATQQGPNTGAPTPYAEEITVAIMDLLKAYSCILKVVYPRANTSSIKMLTERQQQI